LKVLGEPTLKDIARELVSHVRKSVTIDWTLRESAQAQIRVLVRRILRKYGYPPDKQEKATQTVWSRPNCFVRNGLLEVSGLFNVASEKSALRSADIPSAGVEDIPIPN
jgi:restriction endonuclease HindI-like protein